MLPADEACVRLGICLTVLKRLCRQFGIQRWPYRRIMSTMRSLQKSKEGSDERLTTQSYFRQQSTSGNNDTSTSDALGAPIQPRPQRPQRQAALGVRDAIVREREGNLSNTEEKESLPPTATTTTTTTTMTTTAVAVPTAPALPEQTADHLAAQSLTPEESHALDMLMANFYQPPPPPPFTTTTTTTTGAVPPPLSFSSSPFLGNHSDPDGLVAVALAAATSHLTAPVHNHHHRLNHPTTATTTTSEAAPIIGMDDASLSTGPPSSTLCKTTTEAQLLSSMLSSMDGQSIGGDTLTSNIAKAVLQLSFALANCSDHMAPPPPLPPLFLNQQQQQQLQEQQQQMTRTTQQRGPFGGSVPP